MNRAVHFITFGNSGYTSPGRILIQANESGFFQSVRSYSEKDIQPLIRRHPLHFILRRNQGFGRFIWKPYILIQRLQEVAMGDFVVYADLGTHISSRGRRTFDRYLTRIEQNEKSIGVFDVGKAYAAKSFVSQSAVDAYLPGFPNLSLAVKNSVYAGLIIARKTDNALDMLQDWLKLCETFLTRPSLQIGATKIPGFAGQDADSGFLPLILTKHQDFLLFPGAEVNLYHDSGIQLKHYLTETEYRLLSWKELSEFPFTLRRDR